MAAQRLVIGGWYATTTVHYVGRGHNYCALHMRQRAQLLCTDYIGKSRTGGTPDMAQLGSDLWVEIF